MKTYILERSQFNPIKFAEGLPFKIKSEKSEILTMQDFLEVCKADSLQSFQKYGGEYDFTLILYSVEFDFSRYDFYVDALFLSVNIKRATMTLPARMTVSRSSQKIEVSYGGWPLDGAAKNFIRDACKSHPNYKLPVDNGGVNGQTSDGKVIVIDTLGKWLFGTPGYKGHIIVEGQHEGKIVCYIPDDCPNEVVDMLQSI